MAGFFCFAEISSATEYYDDLIITEIMYDPDGSNTTHSQWIELYNNGDKDLTLNKEFIGIIDEDTLLISKDGVHYLNCHSLKATATIKPGEFLIISKDSEAFLNDYPHFNKNIIESTFGLSTKSGTIHLSGDKCETFFTETSYTKSWGASDNGMTLEKINFSEKDGEKNWQESYETGGTPGKESSTKPPPIAYSNKVRINEIIPNPVGVDSDFEWIEFYNPSDTIESLDGWKLKDRDGTEHLLKQSNQINLSIQADGYIWFNPNKFGVPLHNSGAESIDLVTPNGDTISNVSYDGDDVQENISYNFDGSSWRWSKFLTPGKENIFNNLPEIENEIPKKIYVNTYAEFFAKGSDKDNDKLKYTWDFGDGHGSYLQNTRHKYIETGKYTVTLKISDGSEDTIKTFEILVEKFPELDVKIVGLLPNPTGADTGTEFLNILNNTKKKINLNGWSVASGTKTLSNHPITEDFFIKAKKVAKLTYEVSKFTLPNTKGKIELRYPNGKVASHVTYGDKPARPGEKTIAEGATYEKTKHTWKWNEPVQKINKTDTIPTPPTPPMPPQIPAPASPELTPIAPEKQKPTEITPDPEVVENLGKFSEIPEIKNKQQNKFSLLNFSLGINSAQAFSSENPPLQISKKYFQLEEMSFENSWLKEFSNNFWMKINFGFNWVLNRI